MEREKTFEMEFPGHLGQRAGYNIPYIPSITLKHSGSTLEKRPEPLSSLGYSIEGNAKK
jgi:hypothetical protein